MSKHKLNGWSLNLAHYYENYREVEVAQESDLELLL